LRAVHEGVATAAIPLRLGGQPYVLALRRRLGDVGRTYDVVETAFAGAALAGLAIALVGGLALSGRMLRRLRALSDAMRAADALIEPPGAVDTHRDELGELARAFAGLQQRLAQQEDARRTFVATASHELRTPLASLQSLLELAAEEADDDDPDLPALRADLQEALEQTRRLGGLSKGLLDLSKLDAGGGLRSEPVELGELSRAVTAEFRARGGPQWIAPSGPAWARGDPEAVARIVRLLVDNALRHAPEAPVEVRTERVNGTVLVRVLDGGPGVADGEREAIFERFARAEGTTAPGFGLGLAIGAELARRMAGSLVLEEGAGELGGARFVLSLPAAESP
jgi:signal transduction histidine kinase